LPRRNTDPLWLQDFYLGTGHDADTRSGTGSFIKRNGKIYVCTCRHIVDGVQDPKMVPKAKFPTLALAFSGGYINLAHMGKNGVEQHMRAPGPATDHAKTDIAIGSLDAGTWDMYARRKGKQPIDLDDWKEPDWSKVRWGLANGYPDEHKENVKTGNIEEVANRLVTVVAEVTSNPHKDQRTITLNSALNKPHNWYFSGLSGGPLYVVEGKEERDAEDEELFPVGIVYEGYPSSGRPDNTGARDAAQAFLNQNDLFIRALALTPAIFDEWLAACGL